MRYDLIINGAGHNGLIAAFYLARAGQRVLLVDARPLIGGSCVPPRVIVALGGKEKTIVSAPSVWLAAVIASRKVQSAALHSPSSLSAALLTTNVVPGAA